jgi:hypothetical protein
MIQRVVKKHTLTDDTQKDDLLFWKSRSSEERIAAVELLRKERYGSADRLQRIARVIKSSQS